MPELAVLDASVGVKLFRKEPDSHEARAVWRRHTAGSLLLCVDHLFLYEVTAVLCDRLGPHAGASTWRSLTGAHLAVAPLDDRLVNEAIAQSVSIGCRLYDAFSAGLATLLDAPLYSADRKAHERYPDVRMIGAE